MGLPRNIHSYADVADVLAAALPHGKVEYEVETPGAATRWAMRANKYRLLLQESVRVGQPKGFQPPTPYDKMKVRAHGNRVEIDFDPKPTGKLILPGGNSLAEDSISDAITPSPVPPASVPLFKKSDPGLEEAARILLEQQDED